MPAQLFIGSPDKTTAYTIELLQRRLCAHNGCKNCITCKQIAHYQHHAVIWVRPEKQYTLKDLAPITTTISFALSEDQCCYFIITQADHLSAACANSLLKSIEEPPCGYHFILHAQHQKMILPTIASRCIAARLGGKSTLEQYHELYSAFTVHLHSQPSSAFFSYVGKLTITEHETRELLDQILQYWMKQARQAIYDNNIKKITSMKHYINVFTQATSMLPMPGSSKLFWKNVWFLTNIT